jgi:prepilin-type N-terminal cleavage/methylation domain-containing protein
MKTKVLRNDFGFTIVELVMVITLVGIIAAAAALPFAPALDSWSLGSSRSVAVGTGNNALNRMIIEIAQIKNPQSVTTATADTLTFLDTHDSSIQYNLAGGNLMRNSNILARGVQSLSFIYWDVNHQPLATPQVSPSATDIWRIQVSLTCLSGNQTIPLESNVHPRNLPRS